MKLTVNGDTIDVTAPCTIQDLLVHLDMATGRVAVEVNREIAPRSSHRETQLRDGDIIEIVHAIGGG
jgi:sulfur carrier protein